MDSELNVIKTTPKNLLSDHHTIVLREVLKKMNFTFLQP
jgi:hypothetical protein